MANGDACADCEQTDVKVWLCSACTGISFCDGCWPRQAAHKAKTTSLGGRVHTKEDRATILMIRSILEPPMDPQEVRNLHVKDQDSKWFGVVKSSGGRKSEFCDFGRYGQMMMESRPLGGAARYPKLVSFIGDTYAGKSTIVKALVSHGGLVSTDPGRDSFHTPVPGSRANEGTATSEGVHLYADPEHLEVAIPILYADCEGLNAGEKIPFAAEDPSHSRKVAKEASGQNKLKMRLAGRSVPIQWTKANDPIKGTREYAVTNLYPRFLYTFSDALVFVQRNPNQLHITYKYLVDFAKRSVEKSLNQPILPSAIVVLNAVEVAGKEERWTIEDATRSFFRDVQGITTSGHDLRELAKNFASESDCRSLSARELLKCYYRSVRVIRIPAKSSETYNLINKQILLLREEIIRVCQTAHYEKSIKRRLANADDLQQYLQAGFEHFANDIETPFDFRTVSTRNKLIAHDFSDHILTLARTIHESTRHERLQPKMLLGGLCSLIASCILLDYVRNNLQGPVIDYFAKNYAPFCRTALYRFCNDIMSCEYASKKIPHCCNVKSAHDKGHQNEKGKREIGPYRSSLMASLYEKVWIKKIEDNLKALNSTFIKELSTRYPFQGQARTNLSDNQEVSISTDIKLVSRLHEEKLAEFFSSQIKSSRDFISCVSCFRCLMATPEYALECGHILCGSCIREHGEEQDDLITLVGSCPLHRGKRSMNWKILKKPEFAGLRILCLDGGGIRGAVELEILRAIENCINNYHSTRGIHIQQLFDLIVGTSTGGIIALGLVAAQWPVSKCTDKFTALCKTAFTEREFADTIFEKLATLNHGSKYKTTPLHQVLQESFGNHLLFGGKGHAARYATKVAVVSTSGTGNRSLIMANYNRQETSDPGYTLETASAPNEAFRVWEAAAATSAAPSYFKPFVRRGRTYLDGAINHNNPAIVAKRERRLLWPDVESRHPDIFLSLGTGQHAVEMGQKLNRLSGHSREDQLRRMQQKEGSRDPPKKYRAWKGIKNYFSVLVDKIDNILDTEWSWHEFYRDTVGEQWATEFASRYVRINPDLGEKPPPLDAKSDVNRLQRKVYKLLRQPPLARDITEIANALVASTFYFKKDESHFHGNRQNRVFVCTGEFKRLRRR
ncbi:uncharacterized protein Z519_01558 [Cladophialophora bantiana CBS 173.52]|uniref:PNPLA domain-containing protein n=1 Tax=Cladophialophora bantiana (strain ATCC 10958 / CBS 173.52 / CDC B-1940 / NIH 8579) TaxID=1442370 RepID=A0A0D2IMJ5_CLAB1|nr:uncharacterized protein Z519_01558 [Cladophialophora bantiana CBS 173.52]KIW97974.1 hypothetical protein Z519_01558 [Cladophialophora bantiana CBS 173.52]